ncbi:MAG: ATP-dependent nuclease [Sulfitobacter sp.]
MPRIRRIQIKNFRSIKNLDVEVQDLATFVGDNDSGKSNILRALNLFFNNVVEGDESLDFERDYNKFAVTNRRAPQIEVTLTFELPENYHDKNGERAIWRKKWRPDGLQELRDWNGLTSETSRGRTRWAEKAFPARSKVPALLNRVEFEYVPAIRGKDYLQKLRGRIYRVISEVSEQSFRNSSTDFENAIGENVSPLIEDISTEIQDSTLLKLPNDLSAIFETLDFLSGQHRISLDQRGDGVKGRYVPLILKFIADKKSELLERGGTPYTFIWAYEEPENNLEMRRAYETAELFRKLAVGNTTQILLTTHSPIFFNLESDNELTVSTSFVSKADEEAGSHAEDALPTILELDEKMGVMPIVAPHMATAMEELEIADRQRQSMQQTIDDLVATSPTLYVEGESDYIVVNAILNAMNVDPDSPVKIERPPQRAGANYVANMLRAWEFKTKHEPGNRIRSVGFVDCDFEGCKALGRFSNEFPGKKNPKHVKLLKLPKSSTVSQAHACGLQFANCLEELFPSAWWSHADAQGWLGDRDPKDLFSLEALNKALDEGISKSGLYDGEDWELHTKRCILDEHKVAFANWVAERDPEVLLHEMGFFRDFLAEQLEWMGVTLSEN